MEDSAGLWERLAAINMTMHRRVVEHLSAAVGAVNMAAQGDRAAQLIWREHAARQIMRAHNTFTAWNNLIRYRAGERPIVPFDQRSFRLGDLLDWLAIELRLPRKTHSFDDMQLHGSRDTLQEGLVLLHSCAFALGPGVGMVVQPSSRGVILGVRYRKYGDIPLSLNALLDPHADNWRQENLAFELSCVRDFLAISGCSLNYQIEERHCGLTAFVPSLRHHSLKRRLRPHRPASEPFGQTETFLSEEGLRNSVLRDLDDDDPDVTLDSDYSVWA